MKRHFQARAAIVAATAMLAGACATTGEMADRRRASEGAPVFPVHQALYMCAGSPTRNAGLVSSNDRVEAFTPWIETRAGHLLRNPTQHACMSSGFGFRGYASGGSSNHQGIDLANAYGGLIYAAGDGRVVSAGTQGGYGQMVVVDHGRGVQTRYAHLTAIAPIARPGAVVMQGEAIGEMGRSGTATGVHLHYELRINDRAVDPLTYGPYRR